MKAAQKPRQREPLLQIAQSYSLQAEQAIIGAILSDPVEVHYDLAGYLSAEHFYDPFCRACYEKSMELLEQSKSLDAVVLSSSLEGLIEMTADEILTGLNNIYDSYPAAANVKGWAEVVIDKSVERNLARAGDSLAQMAHAQNLSRDDKLAQAHRLLSQVGSTMARDTVVDGTTMMAKTLQMIEKFTKAGGKITGTPTGFKDLDDSTSGLGAGDLVIIGARPSMGKTAFCLSLAKHVCSEVPLDERKGVLLFSLEMGSEQIGLRWLGVRKGLHMQHLRAGRISQSEQQLLQDAMDEMPDVPFFVDDTANVTVEQIAAIARRQHAERPLGLIVIDYLQLIKDNGNPNASKSERVGEISRALKLLARELKVPVIALSQLSRELEKRQDKRPIMSDLRESGAIEQDADIILFLYRDEVYNANTVDANMAEVIIAKQRNGPLGVVKLRYDKPTTCFQNITPVTTAAPF